MARPGYGPSGIRPVRDVARPGCGRSGICCVRVLPDRGTSRTLGGPRWRTVPRPCPSSVLATNKYRSHDEQVPFSRRISTVLATNKYRSHDEQVPFSRGISTVLTVGWWGPPPRGGGCLPGYEDVVVALTGHDQLPGRHPPRRGSTGLHHLLVEHTPTPHQGQRVPTITIPVTHEHPIRDPPQRQRRHRSSQNRVLRIEHHPTTHTHTIRPNTITIPITHQNTPRPISSNPSHKHRHHPRNHTPTTRRRRRRRQHRRRHRRRRRR